MLKVLLNTFTKALNTLIQDHMVDIIDSGLDYPATVEPTLNRQARTQAFWLIFLFWSNVYVIS